ncbi:hypothetical protein GCM10010910_15600 [Microbacterium nanhaiense]|uniref:Condensation domain-containing protein n=1 Tax=Microbacterium nanhaiense TaxID=1301026 RepID=A0ABQ2N2H1_9MICO|nr:hypothetical protein [Microbacterium nanhaiense]GGO63320.1 hypothetical protein GCM10010910_15600 [Microbacterium nanhaiense]
MNPHLQADPDPTRWVAIRGSGIAGSRHRKAAIKLLMSTVGITAGQPGSGLLNFIATRTIKAGLRNANGRFLAWSWKEDPSALAALAQVQEMSPHLRAARASMPMEFDDTENFANPHLGVGEKLVMESSAHARMPFVSYTWDLSTHLITLHAVCADRERFLLFVDALDELARTLRWVEDLRVDENNVMRLPEA